MAARSRKLRFATRGIIISLIGIVIWWRYYIHLDHIEREHAWACVSGTQWPDYPPQCTGIYNPGIKHDLLYGSLIILIIFLISFSIYAFVSYIARDNGSKNT